jgi:pimeloyl-ACP methyl ester carboxylesterase
MSVYLADAAENQSVTGPSARFTYRRMGTRGGVPVVLLNRFRGTIDWWDPEFLELLAARHDVIVFDNVGIGHTAGEPRDSVEGFADGAIEFIEALGLAQVDLLGWSLGGIVAQYVVLRRPELVRRLIVAGSSPGAPVPGAPPMSQKVRQCASAFIPLGPVTAAGSVTSNRGSYTTMAGSARGSRAVFLSFSWVRA